MSQVRLVNTLMKPHGEMLINGCFIGGPCDQAVPKAVIRSPFDDELVGTAAEGDAAAAMTALDSAQSAFETFRHSTIESRQALLREIAQKSRECRQELAELMVEEIGKPISAGLGEVDRLALTFEIAAEELDNWGDQACLAKLDPRGKRLEMSVKQFPKGVVFGIVPYNWPYNLSAHKIAPALAVGSTVVIKSSPKALLSTYRLGRLIHEAGAPHGSVNVISCPNSAVLDLIKDQRVKNFSFTGSESVGWMLKSECWDGCHCSLELGGDAFAIMMDDANFDDAISKIVVGAYGYAGQVCIKVQHLLVHSSIYEKTKLALIQAIEATGTGDPSLPTTICGPLIDDGAVSRAQELVHDAVNLGAKLLTGGAVKKRVMQPAVLEDVSLDCRLMNEEAFSPILTLHRFEHLDETIQMVKGSRFGIHCGVFTQDQAVVDKLYSELETGGLVVNHVPTLRFDHLPYGGEKRSGFGREGVRSAMYSYSYPKSLVKIPV